MPRFRMDYSIPRYKIPPLHSFPLFWPMSDELLNVDYNDYYVNFIELFRCFEDVYTNQLLMKLPDALKRRCVFFIWDYFSLWQTMNLSEVLLLAERGKSSNLVKNILEFTFSDYQEVDQEDSRWKLWLYIWISAMLSIVFFGSITEKLSITSIRKVIMLS